MEPIPVDLIAGRKHSGKTTLINRLVTGPYGGEKVVVFTNETGDATYDATAHVQKVLGGCVCCTAQAALIGEIRNALWFEAPDRLVVELAGEASIREMLTMFSYLPDCRLNQLIYVLNARKFRALATVMGPGFSGEIQAAPVLFLNRWQEISDGEREWIRSQVRTWNPDAALLTDFAAVEAHECRCGDLPGTLTPPGPSRRAVRKPAGKRSGPGALLLEKAGRNRPAQ